MNYEIKGILVNKLEPQKGQGKNAATKTAEKLGFKTVQRPKRPSHTRMIDYLDENK